MTADDNVIDADQPPHCANGQDDWQRRKSGGDKRQTNDVRLAGAPIAVEQCGGSFPVQIARSVHARTRVQNNIFNQLRHCFSGGESPLRARSLASSFSAAASLDSNSTQSDILAVLCFD